ncbi:hypothetical protein RYX36_001275 [Vicia faba]
MQNIHRRKAIFSHSADNANRQGEGAAGAAAGAGAGPLTESERQNYKAQIEKLRQEKEQLVMERQRHEVEWKTNEMQLHYSKDRLQHLELNQQSLLASVGQVLQRSAEEASLLPESADAGRKRRYRANAPFGDLPSIEIRKENAESMTDLSIDMERLDVLESSLTFWENFVKELNNTSYETPSNLDFDDSMNHSHSSGVSGVQIDVEVQPESSGNQMNSVSDIFVSPDPDPVELEPGHIFVDDPVAPEAAVIAVPDPVASEPAVTAVPHSVAPELPVIAVPDSVAPEPAAAVVPDSVALKEQQVATIPGTNAFNIPFWQKYLVETPVDDESEIRSELSKYCWTRRHLKPPQIDKAGKA